MNDCVCLLSSWAQVENYKLSVLAADPKQALGVIVSTPDDWFREAWGLWGDGRSVVDSKTLTLLCFKALLEQESVLGEVCFPVTKGTASSFASFFRDVAGPFDFADMGQDVAGNLSSAEWSVVELGVHVEAELRSRGLCLPGRACEHLLATMPRPSLCLVGTHRLPPYLEWFLGSLGAQKDESRDEFVPPLSDGVRPAFLFPSGPNATFRLLGDYLLGLRGLKRTPPEASLPVTALVVCKDPLPVFNGLEPHTFGEGVRLEVDAQITVSKTHWGRFLRAFVASSSGPVDASLVDCLSASPLSGLSPQKAELLVMRFRQDRSLPFGDVAAFLRKGVPSYECLETLFESGFSDDSVARVRTLTSAVFADDQQTLCVELAAIESIATTFKRSAGLFLERSAVLGFAEDAIIPLRFGNECDAPGFVVRIVDPRTASEVPSSSFDVVVLAEGDSVSYAAMSSHAALDRLESKLGVAGPVEPSALLRRWFAGIVSAARSEFCCCFCPVGFGGDERYPAFFVDELASHYRQGEPVCSNALGIGSDSGAKVLIQGEDDVLGNLVGSCGEDRVRDASIVSLSHVMRNPDALFRSDGSFVLSASALEAYLSCPRKWFLARKLKADPLDEGFGTKERGSFVHEVWRRFYSALAESSEGGVRRVTPENLDQCRLLLGGIFDQALSEQSAMGPGRYLPVSDFESKDAESLRSTLMGNLSVHARLLPGFSPRFQEYAVTPEDRVEFAGAYLQGSVDRIDVDDAGRRFVVVDYKGKITGHAAGFDPDATDKKTGKPLYLNPDGSVRIPAKVQALVYSQALRRMPSFSGRLPGGALYVSYRAQEPASSAAGSCSEVVDAGVPLSDSSVVRGDYMRYLDLIEESLVPYVEKMKRGIVPPEPSDKAACLFCPDLDCPRRLS